MGQGCKVLTLSFTRYTLQPSKRLLSRTFLSRTVRSVQSHSSFHSCCEPSCCFWLVLLQSYGLLCAVLRHAIQTTVVGVDAVAGDRVPEARSVQQDLVSPPRGHLRPELRERDLSNRVGKHAGTVSVLLIC